MIVSKVVSEMGFEVAEAEDGEKGLATLEEVEFDLIVLDVTMPVLDGPGMLAKMRTTGNKTPVLMLTSESKRSVVAELMKLGIDDYILKPFKNEDLKAKISRVLKAKAPGLLDALAANKPADAPRPAEPSASEGDGAPSASRQFADVLVVDDMDNVSKRLRSLIPQHLSLVSAPNGQAALKLARESLFRLILVDRELPDMQGAALVKQLRVLQPSAACLAMSLRTSQNIAREVKDEGFDDLLIKPFGQDAVDDLLQNYFQTQDLLTREDEVLAAAAYTGRPDRVDRYYNRLSSLVKDSVRRVAEACFETVIFDAGKVPPDATRLVQFLSELSSEARKVGLTLSVVGPDSIGRTMRDYEETKEIRVFPSIGSAREASV
jgi:DNA-binding response OmpR family regulator